MKLLANPVFVRMAVAFLVGLAAFVAGVLVMRALRRRLVEDSALPDSLGQEPTLYPYTAVIQQLKQQKFELQNEQQQQRRRAKTYEQMSTAVIANLPCGVLFIAPSGLVKQTNAAARQMLGFASPVGMSLDALFRNASAILPSGSSVPVADAVKAALKDGVLSRFEASYHTAGGEDRALGFTLIPLSAAQGEVSGIASVITDESVTADSRRARLMHSEISAEMAMELRSSISIIRECAAQVIAASDRESAANFAKDISAEAERLDRVVGSFLAGNAEMTASAGRA